MYPEDGLRGHGQMGRGLTSAPQTQRTVDLHDNTLHARVNTLLRGQERDDAHGALSRGPGEISSHGEAEKAEPLTKTAAGNRVLLGSMAKKFLFFVFFFPQGGGESEKTPI